ncbi:uncharacterized protein LOC127001302 isoform X1 [Eriocheir sinensis]|uniref:uncharacterized protein LOC127001302 isoform X1 n=1 Tax=Eriocheir sinensis TaxID=95602 RepID=UPI0021C68BC7|nr:uncharacterized protein LOC127001302 isoform X1 [Eriocheir sinensis]
MDYTSSRCEASKLHGNSVRRSPQCPTPKVSLDSSVTPLPSMILGRLKIPLYSFLAMAARSASAIQHHLLSVSRPFTCCRGLLKMATLTLVLAGGVTLCTAEPSSSSENNPVCFHGGGCLGPGDGAGRDGASRVLVNAGGSCGWLQEEFGRHAGRRDGGNPVRTAALRWNAATGGEDVPLGDTLTHTHTHTHTHTPCYPFHFPHFFVFHPLPCLCSPHYSHTHTHLPFHCLSPPFLPSPSFPSLPLPFPSPLSSLRFPSPRYPFPSEPFIPFPSLLFLCFSPPLTFHPLPFPPFPSLSLPFHYLSPLFYLFLKSSSPQK